MASGIGVAARRVQDPGRDIDELLLGGRIFDQPLGRTVVQRLRPLVENAGMQDPDMDRVEIASIPPTWDLLTNLLESL